MCFFEYPSQDVFLKALYDFKKSKFEENGKGKWVNAWFIITFFLQKWDIKKLSGSALPLSSAMKIFMLVFLTGILSNFCLCGHWIEWVFVIHLIFDL